MNSNIKCIFNHHEFIYIMYLEKSILKILPNIQNEIEWDAIRHSFTWFKYAHRLNGPALYIIRKSKIKIGDFKKVEYYIRGVLYDKKDYKKKIATINFNNKLKLLME